MAEAKLWIITRAKANLSYQIERVLINDSALRDQIVRIGRGTASEQLVRLIEVTYRGKCYRYVTTMLDETRLPAIYIAALYAERWRIEEAFLLAKRLLGLAYLHSTSLNAVQVQLYCTWLMYAALIELRADVAQQLQRPVGDLSLEMLYRALYHYTQAVYRNQAVSPIDYLSQNAVSLGIIKRKRTKKRSHTLNQILVVDDLTHLLSDDEP
jgi:hypothetical protein